MNTYTTLDSIRKYATLASQSTADDEALLNLIDQASRAIDRYTHRKFYPRLETRFYDHPKQDSRALRLDDDLLDLKTFKTMNGACTVASGVMWLSTGGQWNYPPYDKIILKHNSGSVLNFSGTPQRSNEVTGVWGYHEDYAQAWVNTGTSLAADYTASAGSISLAGAGSYGAQASDVNGIAPRIAVGDTLMIANHYFAVTAGSASGNGIVIVRPYINGTVPASIVSGGSIASGASIAKWAPEPDIEWAAKRLTAWTYGQRDTPYQNITVNRALGTIQIPQSWPPDVLDRMERFKRRTITVLAGIKP